MIVIVVMIMLVIMSMLVVVIVLLGFEECRLDLENTVEIEGVAAQHLVQGDLCALGLVQPRVRVDAADAGLDLAQFGGRHQIGLVDAG